MNYLLLLLVSLAGLAARGQQNVAISFKNDLADVYHLSLVIYTPDGKNQTRVSDVKPSEVKTYSLPIGSEIFIADRKQEAYAMKGNDLKQTGAAPTIIVTGQNDKTTFNLSSLYIGGRIPPPPVAQLHHRNGHAALSP